MTMDSCIYEGVVRHQRMIPRPNKFDFRLFMFSFDLGELDSVFKGRWLWSTRRLALGRLRTSDHLIEFSEANDLRRRVELTLEKNGFHQPIGPVRLVTQLRYFGFAMNPVSFFYCYDPAGQSVTAIIAEVNNTPWGEQHCYVIPANQTAGSTQRKIKTDKIEKTFHVSPFMSLDMSYKMKFSIPSENLTVKITNLLDQPDEHGSDKIHDVSMGLKRRPITGATLALMLLKYPLYSFKVFAGIYWQAVRLYFKKVPFVPHPKPESSSESRVKPIDSLEIGTLNSEELDTQPNTSESDPESLVVSR